MKKIFSIICICLFVVNILYSFSIVGSQQYEKKVFLDNTDFTSVEIVGVGSVKVVQSNDNSIVIETDENIFDAVGVELDGKTARISVKQPITTKRLKVIVKIKALENIKANQIGLISINKIKPFDKKITLYSNECGNVDLDIDADVFECNIDGSGKVNIKGKSQEAIMDVNNCGLLDADNFIIQQAIIRLDSIGKAQVNVQQELSLQADGVANFKINGNPKLKKYQVN